MLGEEMRKIMGLAVLVVVMAAVVAVKGEFTFG